MAIQEKYAYDDVFTARDFKIPNSGGPWKSICSAILNHPQAYSFIKTHIRKRVGDGSSTLFWHDLWVGSEPLKLACPRLFKLNPCKDATIATCGIWDGLNWKWCLSWLRTLRPQDECELQNLHLILHEVHLSPSDHDSLIWTPSSSGLFTTKSISMELSHPPQSYNENVIKGLWKNLVPYRVEIFLWLALLGKLNTKEKLARIGVLSQLDASCVLCNQNQEDGNHLFLHCYFSHQIWTWWLGLWNLNWVLPSSLSEAFIQWSHPPHGNFFKKVWKSAFIIMVWSIWKERNARCFDQKCNTVQGVQTLILMRLCWWMKSWDDKFPYNPNDVIRNPHCLKWEGRPQATISQPLLQANNMWVPPPSQSLKWNVDASLNMAISKSAIGGVLRDEFGNFKCLFSSPIPLMEINHAEVLAIHRALKISLASNLINHVDLIIESDSLNAVKWCTGENYGPWNLSFFINFIRGILKSQARISLIYKGRESNVVADSLAKQGLRRLDDFVAWL